LSKRILSDLKAVKAQLIRDNAILLNTYDKLTNRFRMYFNCHCGKENNKLCQVI